MPTTMAMAIDRTMTAARIGASMTIVGTNAGSVVMTGARIGVTIIVAADKDMTVAGAGMVASITATRA